MFQVSTTKNLKRNNLKVEILKENSGFRTELNKLKTEVLITLPSPKHNKMIETYEHMKGNQMNEKDIKLNCQYILGASDYVNIKMQKCPRVGKINELIAEQTKTGWVIMPPGRESDSVSSLKNIRELSWMSHRVIRF